MYSSYDFAPQKSRGAPAALIIDAAALPAIAELLSEYVNTGTPAQSRSATVVWPL